jgi:hypothetical protein
MPHAARGPARVAQRAREGAGAVAATLILDGAKIYPSCVLRSTALAFIYVISNCSEHFYVLYAIDENEKLIY